MLDIKFIRNNVDKVKKAIELKNDYADIDKLIELDVDKRKVMTQVEELKHQRNKVSEQIARMKKQKQDASPIISEMKNVSDQIKELDEKVKSFDLEIYDILIRIPNIPHDSVPVGKDASANLEVKRWGGIAAQRL